MLSQIREQYDVAVVADNAVSIMKAFRLYIIALYFGAMAIMIGAIFGSRQLLRLLPVIGLPAFLGVLTFITVGTITICLLNMANIGWSYGKARSLVFVGFAIGVGTMWINLVRQFAPSFYLPVGIAFFMILLLISWRIDRNERRNTIDSKNIKTGRT